MTERKPEIGVMGQLMTQNVLDDLDFVIKNKFQWFEIDLDWKQNFDLDEKIIKEIRNKAKKNNIKLIVHTPWYLPVSTILPDIKKGVIENIRKAIIFAKKVGADRMTIHPGYREMPGPAIKLCYESLIENLTKIVEIANKYKINVCFENFDKNAYILCSELEDYSRVLNSVKGLKTTLDVGHANTTSIKPSEYLESVKNTIMDMHVHDNNSEHDEHKCLGEGNIDFKKLFSTCKRIGYYGPFTLELFPYDNLLKGREILLKLWEDAK